MARVFDGINAFARFVGHLAEVSALAPDVAIGRVAKNGYDKALAIYGDSSKLASLAPFTQEERISLGFTPNEPLKRTGTLRSELEFEHRGSEAGYGSSDPVQLYHELGYMNARTGTMVEPRPVLRISVTETIVDNWIVVRETAATMIGAQSLITE